MRPSLSGRSLSLYSSLYSSATALYSAATAICRYAGSTAGFVHILGLHLSTVLGALLSLHYSSIAASAPSQATCTNPALLPPSSSIGVVPNCGKSPLSSGCFASGIPQGRHLQMPARSWRAGQPSGDGKPVGPDVPP